MARVKYADGTGEWVPTSELKPLASDTTLKDVSCPFCKGIALAVKSEKSYGGEQAFQCVKCSQRFAVQNQAVSKLKKKTYCPHCGKKAGTLKSLGIYECESCLNKFNQGGN